MKKVFLFFQKDAPFFAFQRLIYMRGKFGTVVVGIDESCSSGINSMGKKQYEYKK
jgi:hypothetical protein